MDAEKKLTLSCMNEYGVYFHVVPLISMDMEAAQIKAELKVAIMKLDDKMLEWKNTFRKKINEESPNEKETKKTIN